MNALAVCATLLAFCGAGCSVATNSCPAITATGHSCSASTDCTGLMCQVPSSANLSSASASIRLQSCDDPPQIHFQAQGQFANGTSFNFSYKFQESKIVFNEEAYIGANVWRNLTSLRFSAFLATTPPVDLIPPVDYTINTTDCLCASVQELANKIHSPFEHDCMAHPNCSGVRCALDVLVDTYYLDVFVLSCVNPPGMEMVMEDSDGNPLYERVFNQTEVVSIPIGVFLLPLSFKITHRNYSMDIEANLTVTLLNLIINIVPLQTIYLDPNTCPPPPPPVSPTPPPVITPPPMAEDLCNTLFDIVNNASDSLPCTVVVVDTSFCTSLVCKVVTQANSSYVIDIRFTLQESDIKAYVKFSLQPYADLISTWEVTASNGTREYALSPQGSTLTLTLNATADGLILEMLLSLAGQQDTLIPRTSITLPSAANCVWLVPVVAPHPQCTYQSDCQGIVCITSYGYIEKATLSLDSLCADPLPVEFTAVRDDGDVEFQREFTESTRFDYGFVTMQRSDTQLNFSADAVYGNISFIPLVTIPLQPHECSCQSLEELADKIHSPLEHDCATNEDCDGVRCELDVFGTTYHIETILLSCDNPPGLETVIEDENNVPLRVLNFDTTAMGTINIGGLEVPAYGVIEHHPYSIDIQVYLMVPFFGNITVIPPHTLLLDRTTCPIPPTVTGSPPPPVTPTYPPSTSPICQGLIDIAKENAQEPFVCTTRTGTVGEENCDTLECRLDIQRSSYTVSIQLFPAGGDSVATVIVMDRGGTTLREVDVSEEGGLIRVPLTEGTLLFDLMSEGKTLAIKVSVVVENGLTTTLINETVQLTHKGASSSQSTRHTVAIITPVAAVMVIFVLAIFILVVVWYKRCRTQQQFEFKPMTVTYSDMKAQAGAEEGELEGTTEKDAVSNEYEAEKDAVGNEYEAEKDAVGNEYEEVDSKPLTSQQPSDA